MFFGQFIFSQIVTDTTEVEIDSVSIDTISVVEFKNEIYNAKAITRFLQKLDSVELIKTLKAFSTTEDYAKRVINMMTKIEKVQSTK